MKSNNLSVTGEKAKNREKSPRINRRIDFNGRITKSGSTKRKKNPTKPPKNAAEAEAIINELYEQSPLLSLTASMSALTGLRYSDASWLAFDDFVDQHGQYREYIDICQQKPYRMRISRGIEPSVAYRASTVRVFINDNIQEIVEECSLHSNSKVLLFANARSRFKMPDGTVEERPMAIQSANWHHDKVKNKLKIDYALGTHSWRKYFAKKMLAKGVTLEKIRDFLGQSSLTSTNHYLETFHEELAPVIAAMKLYE